MFFLSELNCSEEIIQTFWKRYYVKSFLHLCFSDELKGAFAQTNVTFGLYFSLYEWFNPWYKRDKKNEFTTQEFVEVC